MIDIVGEVNHLLSQVHNPPAIALRWVPCELCDGQGYSLIWVGTDNRREEVESQCQYCDDGFVQVDEGDRRWDEGTFAHPHDRGE